VIEREDGLPKISAPSIPEHRVRQRQKIMVAALNILLTHGPAALNHGAVAKEVALTRPAIYEYFPSSNSLLESVLIDAFEKSQEVIDSRMSAIDDAKNRLEAYVGSILDLAAAGLHRPATAVANWPMSLEFQRTVKAWHQRQIDPLISSLIELGVTDTATMILIGGLIESAIKAIESGFSKHDFRRPILSLVESQIN
jgi:AcrR family transcriptional regulator